MLTALALWLAPTGTIRGTVLDTANGTGVGRVSVRLQSTGRVVLTDDEGRFAFDEVEPGDHELYVSAVDFILVKRAVAVTAGSAAEITIVLSEGTGTYAETVDVRGTPGSGVTARREPAVAAEQTLASRELQQLRGILTNDPMRAVQVLPGVTAGDDFRSEFAIRGAGVPHMTFTFEGISTPFLLHTVQQVHDSGSVAMVNGDVLDEISLLNGAYPQRHGNRLGAEIDFRMREGSRERVQSHLSVSALDASGVAEGPLGASKRGSWLFAARKSYLDLLVERLYPEQNVSFGFTDAQAKFSYDVTPVHQLHVAFTGGRSRLERQPDLLGAGNLRSADNQSALGVVTWRYLPSVRFSLVQRVAAAVNRFTNSSRDGAELDAGDAQDTIYRADLSFAATPGVLIESGGEARHSTGAGREQRLGGGRFQTREDYDGAAMASSAYAQIRLQGPRADATGRRDGWSITPGLRVDHWSLVGTTTASPWIQALWPLTGALTVRAGAGVHRQEPDFALALGARGTPGLRSERAYHTDVGIEGRITGSARWQMTVYNREDRDLFRLPGSELRVVNGALVFPPLTTKYANAMDGHARGVEWLVQRQSPNGFSGWASYALGFTRYHDFTTGETFWGDYDQRHTVNLFGTYRLSDRFSLSARLRYGSNFPTVGYYDVRDGTYFAGTERNTIRVPDYSRIDVRANRTFTWDRKRLTLFLEAINVANRRNARAALPSVNRQTFIATDLYETMVPLIPAVGILLEF
jgi:Carboxypeptidase regulatory-like domain